MLRVEEFETVMLMQFEDDFVLSFTKSKILDTQNCNFVLFCIGVRLVLMLKVFGNNCNKKMVGPKRAELIED
jgi:hypothetical protein